MLTLRNEIRLYVPLLKVNENDLNGLRKLMARAFGGVTMTEATGAWVDDNGNIVEDPIAILSSFSTDEVDVENWTGFAGSLSSALNEDAVLVEINGTGYVVDAISEEVELAELI